MLSTASSSLALSHLAKKSSSHTNHFDILSYSVNPLATCPQMANKAMNKDIKKTADDS